MSKKNAKDQVAPGTVLLVGLGNPGPKYDETRHNIGFMLIDRLVQRGGFDTNREKFKAHIGTGFVGGRKVVFLKPQTYMNLSGQSVSRAADFYNVPPEGIVTFHDELDLPFGTLRLKCGGGAGGHNGLRSIDGQLGNRNYFRVRLGIGRPQHGDVSNFVLQRFDEAQRAELHDWLDKACDAVELLLQRGLKDAQNTFNGGAEKRGKGTKKAKKSNEDARKEQP